MLPFAPEEPRGEDFTTETMNIMDAILSRIGKDDDGLGPNWSSTERIVHKFHMIDVWHRVSARKPAAGNLSIATFVLRTGHCLSGGGGVGGK